jgi:cytochrome c oxidase subunit III
MSDAAAVAPADRAPLRLGGLGYASLGWWGMACAIVTEASLFGYLLFAYLYDAVKVDGDWQAAPPSMRFALPGILVLLASGGAVWWGARAAALRALRIGFLAAVLCGLVFTALQFMEWRSKTFSIRSDAYGSMFFTVTGIHLAHLLAGLVALTLVIIWSALGYFDARRNTPVIIVAAYWQFVVAAGVAVFIVLYITPHLW